MSTTPDIDTIAEPYTEIGDHRVANTDISELNVGQLIDDDPVDILYCDPPWRGTMALFASMRERQTGEDSENIDFGEMLTTFYELIQEHVDGHVFLRGKADDTDLVVMMAHACVNVTEWTIEHGGNGNDCLLVYGATDESYNFSADLDGVPGPDAARTCLDVTGSPGKTVLDPTCGQGRTAELAIRRGMTFYGNEWNEVRATETVERIYETIADVEEDTDE